MRLVVLSHLQSLTVLLDVLVVVLDLQVLLVRSISMFFSLLADTCRPPATTTSDHSSSHPASRLMMSLVVFVFFCVFDADITGPRLRAQEMLKIDPAASSVDSRQCCRVEEGPVLILLVQSLGLLFFFHRLLHSFCSSSAFSSSLWCSVSSSVVFFFCVSLLLPMFLFSLLSSMFLLSSSSW